MFVSRLIKCAAICYVLLFNLCAVDSTLGQPKFIASNFQFERIPPPATVTWQLATSTGEHVDLTISGIQPTLGGQQIAYLITEDQAPSFGLDWQAWSAAVNNPAFNRSIMSWGGATQEQPFQNDFSEFELDRVQVFIMDWNWPPTPLSSSIVRLQGGLVDLPVIPEPATAMIALIAIILTAACNSARR